MQYVYPVYSSTKTAEMPRLTAVQLIYMPAQHKKQNTFAILLAGGGYGAVCTMVESLPVAAKLNELGINCFCLNYRTAVPESFEKGLLPEPLDDLAAALAVINKHRYEFAIDLEDYIVGGFSAGGHIASLWGTLHLGARKYDIAQPKMLVAVYPLITMEGMPDNPIKQMMCNGMFGKGHSSKDINKYDAGQHIDSMYPKTYLVYSTDDPVIPHVSWEKYAAKLESVGVPYKIDKANLGGHGYGLGSETPLRGWVERVIDYLHEDSERL
jgi:acetyl esterase/lipase